jgi:hypothetical protein
VKNVYVASRTLYDALKSAGLAVRVSLAGFERMPRNDLRRIWE